MMNEPGVNSGGKSLAGEASASQAKASCSPLCCGLLLCPCPRSWDLPCALVQSPQSVSLSLPPTPLEERVGRHGMGTSAPTASVCCRSGWEMTAYTVLSGYSRGRSQSPRPSVSRLSTYRCPGKRAPQGRPKGGEGLWASGKEARGHKMVAALHAASRES